MNPRSLSLIVATYNRGSRIARTLDSVLAQTCLPDEILVADDCSTDGTGDWVREHYPTVRVVRTPANLRTSGARNFGAAQAVGDVLMFLDHDDELLPNAVETLLSLRAEFPEARAVHADHTYVNLVTGVRYPDHHTAQPAFHRMRRIPVLRRTPFGRLYGRPLYYALLRGNLLQQPWAIDRDFFQRLGGFAVDIRYCEDWELYLRVTRAAPVAVSDRVISHHYVEGGNLHLCPDQAVMHQRVIRRRLRDEGFRNPRATGILHRRLAGYLKMDGDRARFTDLPRAWRCYVRSFLHWPFDHVVAARCLLWPVQMLRTFSRPKERIHD
jgi:glycosyltransferase involved in cell wall biosynthesis